MLNANLVLPSSNVDRNKQILISMITTKSSNYPNLETVIELYYRNCNKAGVLKITRRITEYYREKARNLSCFGSVHSIDKHSTTAPHI